MPTNVTPEYKKAEEAYRQAREPKERLECLKEMARTIPKHKGTEHLQADIKTRIKQLTEELAGPKKGGKRSGPSYVIRPEGAAQVALIGPPNSGKSSLHVKLTGSTSEVGPYPYSTHLPVPGMIPYDDIHIQLVDLPPISDEFMETWIVNALQPADAAMLVIDLSDPDCLEQVPTVLEHLAEKKIFLTTAWPGLEPHPPPRRSRHCSRPRETDERSGRGGRHEAQPRGAFRCRARGLPELTVIPWSLTRPPGSRYRANAASSAVNPTGPD